MRVKPKYIPAAPTAASPTYSGIAPVRESGAPNVSSHSASDSDAAVIALSVCNVVHTASRIGPTREVVQSITGSCS